MYFTKDKKIMGGVDSTLYEMDFAVHNCENEKKDRQNHYTYRTTRMEK
jgi:hypothetical protein